MNKITKSFLLMIILILISVTTVQAMSITIQTDPNELKVNEEIKVEIILDEPIVTSDFKLKYDVESFQFISADTEYLHTKDYINYGYVSSIYANLEGKGTQKLSFKFKAIKEIENTIFEIIDMNCTTENATVYDDSNSESNYKSNTVKVINRKDSDNNNSDSNNSDSNNSDNNNSDNNNAGNNNSNNNSSDKDKSSTNNSNNNNSTLINKNGMNGNDATIANKILPKTGTNTIIIIAIVFLIILMIFLKKRVKFLKDILPIFIVGMMIAGNHSYAYEQTIKIFKFSNQIDSTDIYSIILNTVDIEKRVTAEELKKIINNIDEIKSKDNGTIGDNDLIGTGTIIALKDSTQAKIILYGDATGEGKINSNDIYVMIQHMLNKGKLTGIYAKAVNLSNKEDTDDEIIDKDDILKHIDFLLGILETDLVEKLPEGSQDLSQYIDVKFERQEDEKLQKGDKCKFYIVVGEQTSKAHCTVTKKLQDEETILLDNDITETNAYQVDVEKDVQYEIKVSIADTNNTIINSITAKINMISYIETEEGTKERNETNEKALESINRIEIEIEEEISKLEEEKENIQREVENSKNKIESERQEEENYIINKEREQRQNINTEYNNMIANIQKLQNNGSITEQEAYNMTVQAQERKETAEQQATSEKNTQIQSLNKRVQQQIQDLEGELESACRKIDEEKEELLKEEERMIKNIEDSVKQSIGELDNIILVQKLK